MTAGVRRTGATRDAALLEAFLEMLAAERGASANTLAAYRRDLDDFRERQARLRECNAADIRRYLAGLPERGLAASSQARRLSALRQFFRFLVAEGHRADDPTATAERPKPRRHLPKMLSRRGRRPAARSRARAGRRRRADADDGGSPRCGVVALLELLYATGLRVSELVSLPETAGRGGRPFIAVQGKGRARAAGSAQQCRPRGAR